MTDYIVRATAGNGALRAFAATTKDLVNEAHRIHKTYPVATAALGRMLTAAAMMGATLKSERDLLTLQIAGGGPLGRVLAITDAASNVKGYVGNPQLDLPLNEKGKLDVGGAIGQDGFFVVTRDLGLKEPYIGKTPIVTGEIGDDLTQYFAVSEQVPSVVGLGVLVDVDLSVKAAGGFIVQVMPEAAEEDISRLEAAIGSITSVTALLENGNTPEDILRLALKGFDIEFTDRLDTRYHCGCTQERVERALISIGEQELTNMIEEDGKAEITCHFCDRVYQFDKAALSELLRKAKL